MSEINALELQLLIMEEEMQLLYIQYLVKDSDQTLGNVSFFGHTMKGSGFQCCFIYIHNEMLHYMLRTTFLLECKEVYQIDVIFGTDGTVSSVRLGLVM